jgi:hypothetical protein
LRERGDISGDIASRAAMSRGAFDVIGAGAVGGVLEGAEAFADLGEVALKTAGELGISKTAMAGLGVAAVGVTIALASLIEASKKVKDAVAADVEGREAADQLIATGSRDAIAARLEQIEVTRQGTRTTLDYVSAEQDRLEESTKMVGVLGDLQVAGNRFIGTGSENLNTMVELTDQEQRLTKQSQELDAEYDRLLEGMEGLGAAAEDTSQSTLMAASDAATAIQQQQNASKLGVDAANERIAAIEEETAVVEAEIAVLKQSGDTSEEVTARIAQLVGEQISSGAAKRIDDARQAAKDAEEAAKQQERALEKAQAAQEKYSDSLENIARQTTQATQDAAKKAKDARADLSKELSDSLFEDVIANAQEQSDILRDGQRDEAQSAREHQRELKDIRKEADRSDRDALKNRNFLALEEIAENTKDRIEDAKDERDALAGERKIALNDELQDFKINASRQRQERQRDFNKSLRDLQQNSARELRDISTNRQRQLQLASEARNKELQLTQEFYSKSVKIAQEAINKISGAAGSSAGGAGATLPRGGGPLAGGSAGALSLVESVVS